MAVTGLPLKREPQLMSPGRRRTALALWAAAAVALIASGMVLWTARAEAVFTDMVSAALAWCM
jgi:hypothetical protein